MEETIVENWLRSLGLIQYTQDFIDNGYDELEICKLIGPADLDGMGIWNRVHRQDILNAVSRLQTFGGTRIYFILDPNYEKIDATHFDNYPSFSQIDTYSRLGNLSHLRRTNDFENRYPRGECVHLMNVSDRRNLRNLNGFGRPSKGYLDTLPLPTSENCNPPGIPYGSPWVSHRHKQPCRSLVTFPKAQLNAVIQGKLRRDGIDLVRRGYCEKADTNPESSIEILAMKYANDLHTHHQDVFQVLLDLRRSSTNCDTPSPMEDREWMQTAFSLFSVNGQCHRSIPPPLPPRPPPSNIYEDPLELDASLKASPAHSSRSPLLPQQRLEEMSECQINEDEAMMKRRSLTLGRLLRGGFKKQPKKYVYKQYKGDLSASEITMPDEERIELMIRVKEGKLSMHDAVERVKQYEENKKEPPLQTTLVNGHGHI